MNLIIFDIDGTLTQTNEMDSTYFAKAIEDVLQINDLNTDWASYRYSTDSGLLKEIYASFLKREPSAQEVEVIQERFVTYLQTAWTANCSSITAVPGANTIFQEIDTLSTWHIGIATGGWKKSALFKLDSANIPHVSAPKAYADDHIERTEIIRTAIRLAQTLNNIKQYQQIIYVGDRPWDERAAMQLKIGFIGVGAKIKQQSQHFCVDNYKNSHVFLEHLGRIEI